MGNEGLKQGDDRQPEALAQDAVANDQKPEVITLDPVARQLEAAVGRRKRKVMGGKIVVSRPDGLTLEWAAKVEELRTRLKSLTTPELKKAEMARVKKEEPQLFEAFQISLNLESSAISEQLATNAEGMAAADEVGGIIADAKLKAVGEVAGQVEKDLRKVG
jgi:hypothetical protein